MKVLIFGSLLGSVLAVDSCSGVIRRPELLRKIFRESGHYSGNQLVKSWPDVPGEVGPEITSARLRSEYQCFNKVILNDLLKHTPLPEAICKLIFSYFDFKHARAQKFELSQSMILSLQFLAEGRVYSQDFVGIARIINPLSSKVETDSVLPFSNITQNMPDELSAQRFAIIEFVQSSEWVACITQQGTLQMWSRKMRYGQAIAQECLRKLSAKVKGDYFLTARFSPCESYIFLGSYLGEVCMYNFHDQETLLVLKHKGPVVEIASAPDGDGLAVGTAEGAVYLWSGLSLSHLSRTKRDVKGSITSFSAAMMHCMRMWVLKA